ncbi:hypothetical protein K1X84_08020 [bacterium]|nr:hypothetical protein [bacterium]
MMKRFFMLTSAFLLITSCGNDDSLPPIEYDATALLANVADSVILQTYEDLDTKAGLLLTSVQTLSSDPTEPHLEAARSAWVAARAPWEMSEGFLFGPVDTKGIDPDIDSWPVNVVDLDNVLAGSATLNESYINGLEGTLKGFHTIEYLLFGDEATPKTLGSFTTREFDYLVACVQSFKSETHDLAMSWAPSGENYTSQLKNAGSPSSLYISHKAALQEILQGMIAIADEVANGKIQDPFAQSDVTLEESRFSNNSKADFQNNIRSIRNLYLGEYTGLGTGNLVGISHLINQVDANLDEHLKDELDEAIELIGAIGGTNGTFTDAITNNRSSIEAAQNAVRAIQQTLESEIQPIIDRVQ